MTSSGMVPWPHSQSGAFARQSWSGAGGHCPLTAATGLSVNYGEVHKSDKEVVFAVTLFVPDDMICKSGKGQQELVLKGRSGTWPGILGLGSRWLRPDVQIGHAGTGNPAQAQLSCEHSSNDNQNKPQLGSGSGKNLNHVISTV